MKLVYDTTCPRCNFRMTACGSVMAEIMASLHHCADGEQVQGGPPTERWVPGPGEKTKLPEEKSGY